MTYKEFKNNVLKRTNLSEKQIKFKDKEDFYVAYLRVGEKVTMSANKTSDNITVCWGEKGGDLLHRGKHKAVMPVLDAGI